MEHPSPLLLWFSESFPIPVIDCGNPAFCSFTFQRLLLSLIPLCLQKHVDTVLEPDNKIGFVTMRNLLMLIWNTQTEMIVTDIALDNFGCLQVKASRTFPSLCIQHNQIHLATLCAMTRACREKIYSCRCADRFIAIQDRQQRTEFYRDKFKDK